MRVLLVAADRMELRGILARADKAQPELRGIPARAGKAQPVAAALDWARLVRIRGNEFLLAANGVGWKRAAGAVDRACEIFQPERVVSTGICGALDPELRSGSVVVADCVAAPGRRYAALPVAGGVPHRIGTVYSAPHVVRSTEEKSMLRQSGAVAVEMEAAGVAERAEAHRLPFHCVRSITDLAGETLANDFEAALRPDGHFDTMLIVKAALRHPLVRLPELFRLQSRCARAARVLGEFFADCGF
jgi:nucleoside phosphorylase